MTRGRVINGSTVKIAQRNKIEKYETASQACLRAMCDDSSLTIVYDNEELLDESVVVVPALMSVESRPLLARHRGLLDSYAFMKQFHDPIMHGENTPSNSLSERLFNLLERERFEALGGERYAGVRQNLAALWAGSYTQESIARHGGVEQLEWVVSYLCRERLNAVSAPKYITEKIASLRDPVESIIGSHLIEMALCRYDQQGYAHEALRLIERLGFDVGRARPKSNSVDRHDRPDVDRETEDPLATDIDESGEDHQSEAGLERTHADPAHEQKAALVRNAEHERSVEPALSELALLPEHETDQKATPNLVSSTAKNYTIFHAASDEVVSALDLVNPAELTSLKSLLARCMDQHAYLVRRLVARLQRHLMARQQWDWLDEQEEGTLDTRRLSRLIVDQSTPVSYRIENDAPVRSTTVTILVDNSRSMLGRPIELAAVCVELLTGTLERCGISSEVLGFTTVSMYGGASKARWQEEGEPLNPGRLNGIRHIIYKSARVPARRARECFAVMLKADVLKQNIDGEALQWAHKRLLKRTEEKRLLIVISDGAPSDAATLTANNKDLLLRHLKSVVTDIETRSPVHLLAIGIGHDVSQHYSNAMMIKNAEQLGPALLEQLTRMLIDSDGHQ